jgi:hypothetical protein
MSATRQRINRLLGWSEDRFNNFYIDQAKEFLQLFLDGDKEVVQMVYTCNMFWKWWRNEWHQRDEVYLSYAEELADSRKEEIYIYLHSAKYLDKKPQRPVMEAMMEVVNRELQKEIQMQNAAVYAVQGILNLK